MKSVKEFSEGAKTLARNPLGIIALFIVLVYGCAALVTASNSMSGVEQKPLIWFLALFPVGVLAVFAWLVACHHKKLYGPGDYREDSSFLEASMPKSLTRLQNAAATSDADESHSPESHDVDQLNADYAKLLDDGFCLLHEAEVVKERGARPKSGLYRARVWVEPIEDRRLSDIVSVTYRLWGSAEPNVHTTESRTTNFDLWLNTYGEFPVLASLRFKDGHSTVLQRYIDLPGRPPD
jgi:hypothetical protein